MAFKKKKPAEAPADGAYERPPAELRYADELERLRDSDSGAKPPGWTLSPRAVRAFILGDAKRKVVQKFVGQPSLVDRAMVSLATQRGLMLIGEPGTAKSMLSELFSAAICGRSTLIIQGSAATGEEQIKYGWNYSLLLAEGPSERALVPGPLFTAMREGLIVRFEEITRCPLEIQDSLLSALSDRVLSIPELGEASSVFARRGFNVIATANTRDLGVNEMSAALKRRLNFETVLPIQSFDVEMELVQRETEKALAETGIPDVPNQRIFELLVTTFRELRSGMTVDGHGIDRLSTAMSTAEAVSVAHAVGAYAYYVTGRPAEPADLVECLVGAASKSEAGDRAVLRRYFEQRVSKKKGAHWKAYHEARHRLPES